MRNAHCRGLDIRFKVDTAVFILANVKSHHELFQMVGRSSRSRGVCDSILFIVGKEKSSELIQRLQREGISDLIELERLIRLFEKKCNDSALLSTVKESLKNNVQLRSIQQLKEVMKPTQFSKLMK